MYNCIKSFSKIYFAQLSEKVMSSVSSTSKLNHKLHILHFNKICKIDIYIPQE